MTRDRKKYVIQAMTCPVSASGFSDAIENFTRTVVEKYGSNDSDYWYFREKNFPTLAADANGEWYLTSCHSLTDASRNEMFPTGSWSTVEGMNWQYQEFDERPTKLECNSFCDQILKDEGLTTLGLRGPLDEMFAGTWKIGDRDYKTFISEIRQERSQQMLLATTFQLCLSPKAPLIGRDDSQWHGVVHGSREVFSSALLSGSHESYISHTRGASETAYLWLDDPLCKQPFQERSVTKAVLKIQYRSTGPAQNCLARISSPTVFSEVEILSMESNAWWTEEMELNIESVDYHDWADLGLRVNSPVDSVNGCSPIQISFLEICVTGIS